MICCFFPPKILFVSGVVWFALFVVIKSEDYQAPLSDCELEKLLKPILSPPDDRTIQAQALRQRLLNLLRQGIINEQVGNNIDEKRSISSLAKWNSLPNKRNVQALARAGLLSSQRYDNDEGENDPNLKRNFFYYNDNNKQQNYNDNNKNQRQENKRGIQSLARNGELPHTRQQIEDLLEELYEKRNIGSLARDYNFPSYGKRFVGALARNGDLNNFNPYKRNIASIVRNGRSGFLDEYKRSLSSLARNGDIMGKRNVAALLRQDSYLNKKHENGDEDENENETETEMPENESEDNRNDEKRNLASIKAGYKAKFKREATRSKRQADYYDELLNDEYLQPVYQNSNSLNYDELINELSDAYPTADKRFLGSVARSGWPSSLVKFNGPDKRHIGSLARLGWLPSLRSVRRFNRSGRSTNYEEIDVCRQASSNGKIENNSYTKNPENSKRLLLIPTVDNLRLRRFPMAPRNY